MARLKSRYQIRIILSLIVPVFTITSLVFYWFCIETSVYHKRKRGLDHIQYDVNDGLFEARKLLGVNDSNSQRTGLYPRDIFSLEQREKGAVILHILGVSYMFIALAIVCDEFFVPSLHVISSILKISDDVAGATFMAAGGSAPELFTSFLGVFVAGSNVGFGTIVGSAVFNVLFVIAMCVFFSKGILQLTWWPLLRDCCFYVFSLALLILFFHDTDIQIWESALLFATYIIYVLFMSINGRAERFVKRFLSTLKGIGTLVTTDVHQDRNKKVIEFGGACFRQGAFQLVVHTLDPITEVPLERKLNIIREIIDSSKENDEGYFSENQNTCKLKKDETLNDVDACNSAFSGEALINNFFANNGCNELSGSRLSLANKSNATVGDKSGECNDASMAFSNQDKSCVTSNDSSRAAVLRDNFTQHEGVKASDKFNDIGYQESPKSSRSIPTMYAIPSPKAGKKTETQPRSGSKLSCSSHHGMSRVCLREAAAEAQGADDPDNEEPLNLSFPDGHCARIFHLIKIPILVVLYLTIPDVRRAGWKNFFPATFVISILWIGGFTYLMVWWADQIGETLHIPPEVMGLTFLAAGTSIPDLITSVLVARQGLGDMAISSSIGSNIFDVTVGLPVPWILYSFLNSFAPMNVNSKGLFCSTILLFLMLIAVIFFISLSKWQMTKTLGVALFVLYGTFLTVALLLEFNIIKCVL